MCVYSVQYSISKYLVENQMCKNRQWSSTNTQLDKEGGIAEVKASG